MAEDVRALLPAEELAQLLAAWSYECVECGEMAATAEAPASVVLRLDGLIADARLAHARCSPSKVRALAPGSLGARSETTMTAQAIGIPGLHGDRPAIICEVPGVRILTVGGDDRLMPGMRELGLHTVGRIAVTPPAGAGWQARLPDTTSAHINTPAGKMFYGGPLLQALPWHRGVRDLGWVVLLAGVGLELEADRDPGTQLRVLGQAARQGNLVGATVPVAG